MPSFPIIDAHLHVWDTGNFSYPWLQTIPLLNKPYLLDDYNRVTEGLTIEKMVFVQCECECAACELEAGWVSTLAESDSRIKGIIPWAPLEDGAKVKDMLDRYASNPLIKGVRRIIQFENDKDFCLKPQFISGLRQLTRYDFSFDICVSHGQLDKVIQMVGRCPEVRFVLDHIGKPDISNQQLEPWRSHLKLLSNFENVWCKLSGLVTEASHENWQINDLRKFVNYPLEYFTPARLMFGGDWPVLLQAAEYQSWVQALDELLSELSKEELKKIYHDNADHFYRLT